MDYEEALNWIHSTYRFGSQLGLERISVLLHLLGRPQDSGRFVHVAGTNGKGSVTAMVASILKEAGYRTGTYTSPHLEDFRERIRLGGRKIGKEEVAELVPRVKAQVERMMSAGYPHPTEFEIVTAMAFLYFKESGCDWVSLEVGLGGRFDATNVVTPAVSVITPVSLDHTDRLGNTLGEIAFEEAGIIKPGVPVVVAPQPPEALAVILDRARALGCRVMLVGEDISWRVEAESIRGQEIQVVAGRTELGRLFVPLAGPHQAVNAATAVAVARILTESGAEIGWETIKAGIARTRWPGRLEVVAERPLVILDGAHNPGGAAALVRSLPLIPRRKLISVVGMLKDKDYRQVLSQVLPFCDVVVATYPVSERALDAGVLAEEASKYCSDVTVAGNVKDALELSLQRASSEDAVLIWGSLYLVGAARMLLREKLGILLDEDE